LSLVTITCHHPSDTLFMSSPRDPIFKIDAANPFKMSSRSTTTNLHMKL
jgi:hypothetical protein